MTKKKHLRTPDPIVEYRKQLARSREVDTSVIVSDGETTIRTDEPSGPITLTDPLEIEWIQHCKKAAADFIYFCNFMAGCRVHPGQIKVMQNLDDKDFEVLAAANGWGKTFFYALWVLWCTFGKKYAPRGWGQYRAAVLAPVMQQALITHGDMEAIRTSNHEAQMWCDHPAPCPNGLTCPDRKPHRFRLNPWLIPFRTKAQHEAFRWTHNGAIINFESGENKAVNIEGWRLNVIVYDEARLEIHLEHIVDQVFLARAVRTPNQKILLGSTPLTDSLALLNYFRRGELGHKDWSSYLGPIRDNVFLFPAQVQKVRDSLDERIAEQVLEGKWVSPPDSFFITDKVEACYDKGIFEDPHIGDLEGKFIAGHTYVGGLDIAVAQGGDESVFTLWDISRKLTAEDPTPPCRVIVEHVWPKGTPLGPVVMFCDAAIAMFNCIIAFDASSAIGIEFEHQITPNISFFIPVTFTGGNQMATSQVKSQALANYRWFINNRQVTSPFLPKTMGQTTSYQLKDQHLKKDRLMTQVYAAWAAKDWMVLPTTGFEMKHINRTVYTGQGTGYGGSFPEGYENKTPLQRLALKLSQERDMQRELEMAGKHR